MNIPLGIMASAHKFISGITGATHFTLDTTDEGAAQTLTGFFVKATNATSLEPIYFFSNVGTTFRIPSSASAGDLCVVVQYSYNNQLTTFPDKVIPTGFTEITTTEFNAGNEFRVVFMFKSIVSGDIDTEVTGMNGESDTKFVLILRPETSATYSFGGVESGAGSGNISAQNIILPSDSNASDTEPLVIVGVKTTRDDADVEDAEFTGSDEFFKSIHKRSENSKDASRMAYYISPNGLVNTPPVENTKPTETVFNVNTIDDGAVQNFGAFFIKAENGGTLSEVQFTQSSTISTFNISSDAQAGDICIAIDYHHTISSGQTRPTKVIPTGFTEILDNSTDGSSFDSTLTISYKVLVSGDAGTNKTGYDATTSGRANKTTLIIRPSTTATVTVGDIYSENGFFTNGTNNVVNLPSDSDSTDTNPIIVIGVKCARNDSSNDDQATLSGDDFTATKMLQSSSDNNHHHRVSYYLGDNGVYEDKREITTGNYTLGWGDLVTIDPSSTVNVPYPSGINVGDLLGVRFWTNGNTLNSSTITSLQEDGWDTSYNDGYRIELYKRADGTEPVTTLSTVQTLNLTLTNNAIAAGFMFRMRHDSNKEIIVRGGDGGYSLGDFTFQNEFAYSNGNDACLACFGINGSVASMGITEQSSSEPFVELSGLKKLSDPSFLAIWSSDFNDSATFNSTGQGVNQRVRYYGIPT